MLRAFASTIRETGGRFDSDYQAVLDFAIANSIGLPTAAQQEIDNQVLIDYKATGAWDLDDCFYKFIGDDPDLNFKYIDWKRLNLATITGSSDKVDINGVQVGLGGFFIDTNYNVLNDSVNYLLNDASIYISSNLGGVAVDSSTGVAVGCRDSNADGINIRNARSISETYQLNSKSVIFATAPLFNPLMISRKNSNIIKLQNDTLNNGFADLTGVPTVLVNETLRVLRSNASVSSFYKHKVEYLVVGADKASLFDDIKVILNNPN